MVFLKKNTDEARSKLLLIAGNLMFSMNSFLIVYILSFFFDDKVLGEFTLALSIVVPLFTFADFQLRNYFIIYGVDKPVFFTVVIIKIIFALLAVLLSLLVYYFFCDSNFIFIFSVIILKITDSIYDVLYGLNVHNCNYFKFFKENTLRTSLLLLSFLVLLFQDKLDVFTLLLTFIFVNLFFLFFYLIRLMKIEFKPVFSPEYAREIIFNYFSFSMAVTINSYSTNVPKYFTQLFFGTKAQAALSFYLMIAQAISRLISPIQNYYRKDLSILHKKGDKTQLIHIFKKLVVILGVFFIISAMAVVFVKEVHLLKVSFPNVEILILIFGVYLSTIASIINTILHAMDILTKQLKLSLILIFSLIFLNIVFGYFELPMAYVYLLDGFIMILGFSILFTKGLKKMVC